MNIPSKVKVAGYEYTVERPQTSFLEGCDALDGFHNSYNQTIKVAQVGSEDYQNTVFLHEVLHAILFAYTPNKQDEDLVEQIAKGLFQFIKDNPEIFSDCKEGEQK